MTLSGPTGAADLVFRNGAVATLEPGRRPVEAIAVRAGRVAAVGSTREIEALAGPRTHVIDLAGRSVIPGLADCHVHLATDAAARNDVDVRDLFVDVRSIRDLLERMRERAAQVPPGTWLAARGSPMQELRFEERRLPSRSDLDAALPDHPAYVTFGAHVLIANRKAIDARGIDRTTPNPDRGVVERDPETGEPTGVFLERARILIKGPADRTEPGFLEAAIALEIDRCLARGVTTIHDIVAEPAEVLAYQRLWRTGRLAARVGLIFRVVHSGFRGHPLLELGLLPGFGDGRLWFCGVKMSIDGGFTGGNAAFSKPAHGRPPGGLIRITQEELDDLVDRYDRAGIRISIHAMGDVALDMALAAYERRAALSDIGAARHRIEHMGNWLSGPDHLGRTRSLGIIPVPNPSILFHLADEIRTDLGDDRARSAFPFRAILDAGLPLVVGSDGPGYWPIDVLRDLAVLTSRRTRSGATIGEPSPVSVAEALRAQTGTAAWLGFREADLGTLAPGMRADLVVLAEDPFGVPPERLAEIAVDMTVVDGQIAYERAAA